MTSGSVDNRQRSRIVSYLKSLYGYAYGLTGDSDKARDLVQECALKAVSALNSGTR